MSRIYSSLSGGELFEKITEEGYTMSEAEVINNYSKRMDKVLDEALLTLKKTKKEKEIHRERTEV